MAYTKIPKIDDLIAMSKREPSLEDIKIGTIYLDDDDDFMVIISGLDRDNDFESMLYHEFLDTITEGSSICDYINSEEFKYEYKDSYFVDKDDFLDSDYFVIEITSTKKTEGDEFLDGLY